MNRTDFEGEFDASLRTIDLRIAIGRAYDFDFDRRVLESNSHSLAAIYFTRRQLDEIAEDFGIEPSDHHYKNELMNAMRERVGHEPREAKGFDWMELKSIIRFLGIDVDPDGYKIGQLEPEDSDSKENAEDCDDSISWVDSQEFEKRGGLADG